MALPMPVADLDGQLRQLVGDGVKDQRADVDEHSSMLDECFDLGDCRRQPDAQLVPFTMSVDRA